MTTADLLREELKSCPFCGGQGIRVDIEQDDGFGNAGGSVIACENCAASGPVVFGDKSNLSDIWNARASTDRPPDERDAILDEAINAACQCLAVDQDMANFGNAMIRRIRALKSTTAKGE